jgi:hypothetical protein
MEFDENGKRKRKDCGNLCCFAREEEKVWKRKFDLSDLYYLHMMTQYTIWLANGLVSSQHLACTKVTKVLSTLTILNMAQLAPNLAWFA